MDKSVVSELILANGQKVSVQTSTRQANEGEESTFISIDTGCFRIRIVQRISLDDLKLRKAKIGFSTTSETDDLAAIEILGLSLEVAVKIANRLNEKVALRHVEKYG